ncbi:AMP-binding enzyme family protein (macronuclear) [Tetrahymena thermophila SB210]|uniref:AMP-binding enzyme family protein n=1 Tax=Tetrahymena thermophila (strain SB210) TaxID=312017 RepID=Q22AX8_TETTS|nr:AMP-binding enzyme family protein [Tetrahymena thermophila SB210]EAR82436.1 AMP-binding enzyme family protein [Tetrahymena thermophila SB210]|eukprot:XP_001030099.1 AMP-binding enzyme family protein [Tetrahymena thermophila SB210]
MQEFFKDFDVFSQSFSFNTGKRKMKKRTLTGAFLSVSIIGIVLFYFVHLVYQYFNNQIDPKFRSQSFVTSEQINVALQSKLIAFQFFQGLQNLDFQQKKQNKTYIVAFAEFNYIGLGQFYTQNLNIIDCSNPQLIGYKCIDFSSVPSNFSLSLDNINQIASSIRISTYRCQDVDSRKTYVPNNCASPEEIDNFINNLNNYLHVKLLASQFNITSNQFEDYYKSQHILMSTDQIIFTEFKAQQQITKVKQGSFVQQETQYLSPISYIINTETYQSQTVQKQTQLKYFAQFFLDIDETIIQTQIQYPIFPEILALCNSTFALLMCLGFIGRYLAQQLIRQELFIITLQNQFQGTYHKILKQNNILLNKKIDLNEKDQDCNQGNAEEKYVTDMVFIPSIPTKPCENVLKNICNSSITNDNLAPFQKKFKFQQIKTFSQVQANQHQDLQQYEQIISTTNRSDINKQQIKYNEKDQMTAIKEKLRLFNTKECNAIEINSLITSSQDMCEQTQKPLNQNQIQYSQKNIIPNVRCSNINQPTKMEQNCDQISKINSNKQLSSKLADLLFKFKIRRRSEYEVKLGLNQKTKQLIEEQIDKNSDFSKLYEEIIFLKKAIMILLTKEQFAALKYVGCSDSFLLSDSVIKSSKKINYFEEQFAISLLKEQQSKYFKQFILKCSNNNTKDLTLVDQRIYSSIV